MSKLSSWGKIRRAHILVLILASQYIFLQIATGVEYYDAPRNLHWGIYLTEQPRYLLDASDEYDRVFGFMPTPASLAPNGFPSDRPIGMHSWWGPAYLALIAIAWKISHSYLVLRLLGPIISAILVCLTYAFGRRFFNERIGVLAAFFLSCFPIAREHAVMAYFEPATAVLVIGAFWAYIDKKTWLAVLLGTIGVLGKLDFAPLYLGPIIMITIIGFFSKRYKIPGSHNLITILIPTAALVVWLYISYIAFQRPVIPYGELSLFYFRSTLPSVVPQLFGISAVISYPALGLFSFGAIYAIRREFSNRPLVIGLISLSIGIMIFIYGFYLMMPAASNNPRILIPVLPMFCLLAAMGINRFQYRLREITVAFLIAVLLLGSTAGVLYQIIQGKHQAALMPVWTVLHESKKGYVMTEYPWDCILYARQPATWFYGDSAFRENILHNQTNFLRYTSENQIKYLVIPTSEEVLRQQSLSDPLVKFYNRLPFGRMLSRNSGHLLSVEVRQYIDDNYPKFVIDQYTIYFLDE